MDDETMPTAGTTRAVLPVDAPVTPTMAMRSFAFERLSAIAAVLDGAGQIVDTNEAWRLFAHLNDGTLRATGPAVNYLEVCDRAAADGVEGAAEVAAGLRQILAGERDQFDFEYPCPSPTEDRWFLLRASSAPVAEGAGVVLFHVDITARKLLEERFAVQAEYDELTGLPNRRSAVRFIEEQLALSGATGAPLWVLFMDLDGFKEVNDRHGHHVGDELLVKVAVRASRAVRAQDRLCRFGGDEFVLVCPGVAEEEVVALADRLRSVMAGPFQVGAAEVTVGISVGFASSDAESAVDALLEAADAQMYGEKRRRHHLRASPRVSEGPGRGEPSDS